MNQIKLIQLVKEVIAEAEGQVVDAIATLKVLQNAVKSGSEVTVNGQPLFKMPFINLATLQGGGRVEFPRDERLADMNILVDGEPLELLYKDIPVSKPSTKSDFTKIFSGNQIRNAYRPKGSGDDIKVGDQFAESEMGMTRTSRWAEKMGSTYEVIEDLGNDKYLCKFIKSNNNY